MANTYTNVDLDEILNEMVLGFQTSYPGIRAFGTSHNQGPANPGDNARVQVVKPGNAAEAFDATAKYDIAHANYTQGMTTIGVDIALNTRFIGGFYVDDADTSKRRTPAAEWASMVHEQMHKKLVDFVTTGIDNATYGAAALTSTAANFDLGDMTTLQLKRNALKISPQESVLAIDPDYIAELASSTGLEDISASGDPAPLYDGMVRQRIKGFSIVPLDDINANAQNLVGWIGARQGIQLASAQLGDPASVGGVPQVDNGEFIAYVQDMPINGVSSNIGLNVYVWRESAARRTHYTFEWFGGKALLTSTQLGTHPIARIVSS